MANKVDPTVSTGTEGYGSTGHNTTHQGGLTGNTTHSGGLTSGSTVTGGPHSSHMANKVDPTVSTGHNTTYQGGLTGSTTHSGGLTSGSHGTHNQGGLASSTHATPGHNQHQGLTGAGSHLPGPAPDTAGPHKSDMLNKVDPRVDADLDGSKTVGGNKTYSG